MRDSDLLAGGSSAQNACCCMAIQVDWNPFSAHLNSQKGLGFRV